MASFGSSLLSGAQFSAPWTSASLPLSLPSLDSSCGSCPPPPCRVPVPVPTPVPTPVQVPQYVTVNIH